MGVRASKILYFMRVVHGEILDYNIFGMQNQDECWCGVATPSDGLKIEDSKCNSNKLGGLGDLTMAVYEAAWDPLTQSKIFIFSPTRPCIKHDLRKTLLLQYILTKSFCFSILSG